MRRDNLRFMRTGRVGTPWLRRRSSKGQKNAQKKITRKDSGKLRMTLSYRKVCKNSVRNNLNHFWTTRSKRGAQSGKTSSLG